MAKVPKAKPPSHSHATMAEYIASHKVEEKDTGNSLEHRVVDQDGTTVEFYQCLKGRVPILGKDPELPKKYIEMMKEHIAALERVSELVAKIEELEDEIEDILSRADRV